MNSCRLLIMSLVIILTCNIISCKKKSNDNPFGNERIASIDLSHNGAILHYHIYYDAAGNVDSMMIIGDGTATGSNGYKKFNYTNSSYTITDETNFTYTVILNASGLISRVNTSDSATMYYNGSQLGSISIRVPAVFYPYYQTKTTNYFWQNGDINQVSQDGIVSIFGYDAARNGQPGDPLRISDFLLYGRSIVKTIHLPKDITKSGTWSEQYYYLYDGSNRISQLIKVRNNYGITTDDTTFYGYQYY